MNDYEFIRTLHGKEKVLGVAVEIDGKEALAYMKNDEVEGYILFDELLRWMFAPHRRLKKISIKH